MLVLTRKYQEKIRIGNNITITVLRMKGKAVRLGIEAPTDVPVVRGELSFVADGEAELEAEVPSAGLEVTEEAVVAAGRTFCRATGSAAQWTTDSRSANSNVGTRLPESTVAFSRIPRDNVAKLMPKLVSGAGPLRAMMDQR